jgi:hypothetical protein
MNFREAPEVVLNCQMCLENWLPGFTTSLDVQSYGVGLGDDRILVRKHDPVLHQQDQTQIPPKSMVGFLGCTVIDLLTYNIFLEYSVQLVSIVGSLAGSSCEDTLVVLEALRHCCIPLLVLGIDKQYLQGQLKETLAERIKICTVRV